MATDYLLPFLNIIPALFILFCVRRYHGLIVLFACQIFMAALWIGSGKDGSVLFDYFFEMLRCFYEVVTSVGIVLGLILVCGGRWDAR